MESHPPPCLKDTWSSHIRCRRPPCPKRGVRSPKVGALRQILSCLDLQHGRRGSQNGQKVVDWSKYMYRNEYICLETE